MSGSGISTACNFFLQEEVFRSGVTLVQVTEDTDFRVRMIGRKLTKLVDTPGILSGFDYTFERFAKNILAVPNGIHALGFVITLEKHLTAECVQILEQLLNFFELVPYTFVIFSNANLLGRAHDKQQRNFEILLLNKTLEFLRKLLENIGHRYIILESVLNKEQDYYDTKVDELMKIVQSILAEQKKPFTCFLNDIAIKLLRSKEEHIAALQSKQKDQPKDQPTGINKGTSYWKICKDLCRNQ